MNLPLIDVERGEFSLRCVEDGDIEPIRRWRNAQMVVLRQTKIISAVDQESYFARFIWPQMSLAKPETILVAIEHKGRMIGYGGLVHCSWPNRRAEISVLFEPALVGDEPRYRTALLAFLELISTVGFVRLGLNRLTLETYEIRPFHIAVLEEAGFVLEGRLREHVLIEGAPVDSLIHARIARDSG